MKFTFTETERQDAYNVLLECIHERPDVLENFDWETCPMRVLNASEKNQVDSLNALNKIAAYLRIDTD